MDIVTHVLVGAVSGAVCGLPVPVGGLIAAAPDLPLIGKRRQTPPKLYRFTHSLWFTAIVIPFYLYDTSWGNGALLALLSHYVIDLPTHGKLWAPRLLWPSDQILICWREWEFFNTSWFVGLAVSIIWCALCLFLIQ